jgi:galactose mutarotase-like enzyme
MATERWTLTDVESDVWLDSFTKGAKELKLPPEVTWSVTKRTLRGGLRDGVDLIEVHNGALSFKVVPTRGMGIWQGNYRGLALGWDAPVRGPVHPKFVHQEERGGLGWLQGFDEWIVRCGLDSNGAPGEDVVLDNNGNPMKVNLPLHGRIANSPAHHVEIEVQTQPPFELAITGHVQESALFCPQLELRTRIRTLPNSNALTISDEVVNLKATPSEMELLYHCNFGPPLLDPGAQLLAPDQEVAPRDARATEGIGHYNTYSGPSAGYVEQVYWHILNAGLAVLRNSTGDRAAVLRFNKNQMPYFTQWKNTGALEDGYVTGLEPGTNFPNSRTFEREQGRVVKIEPGQSYRCELRLEVCSNRAQVEAVEQEIKAISTAPPVVHAKPQAKFSKL